MQGTREHCYQITSQALVYHYWKKKTLPTLLRNGQQTREKACSK